MRRSYEYPSYPTKNQNGNDYYSHVHRMARAPSVLTDIPHHLHGQTLFSNQAPGRESYGGQYYEQRQQNQQQRQQNQQYMPEVQKTVEVTKTVAECDKNGNCVVSEETIDVEAGGYIEQKHKGFELFKWSTFKPR